MLKSIAKDQQLILMQIQELRSENKSHVLIFFKIHFTKDQFPIFFSDLFDKKSL